MTSSLHCHTHWAGYYPYGVSTVLLPVPPKSLLSIPITASGSQVWASRTGKTHQLISEIKYVQGMYLLLFGRERVIAACIRGSVSPVPNLHVLLQKWLNMEDSSLRTVCQLNLNIFAFTSLILSCFGRMANSIFFSLAKYTHHASEYIMQKGELLHQVYSE